MELAPTVCDDDVLILESVSNPPRTRRPWAFMGGIAIAACVGFSVRSVAVSSNVDAVTALHSAPWYAAWTSRPQRVDENQCTWDGDDCRASRCCAKAGSRCYVKNHHWASCNETCHSHRKWQGFVHRRGHWTVTDHPVWQCTDITVVRATVTEAPAPVVTVTVPVPAPAPPLTPYSIYERDHDLRTKSYGDRTVPKSTPETVTLAPVTWEDASVTPCPQQAR